MVGARGLRVSGLCRPVVMHAPVYMFACVQRAVCSIYCCCCVQVELCMMMPGHTHEDIDAMFRFIADSLRAKGLIRTIDEFVDATKSAFKDQ